MNLEAITAESWLLGWSKTDARWHQDQPSNSSICDNGTNFKGGNNSVGFEVSKFGFNAIRGLQ